MLNSYCLKFLKVGLIFSFFFFLFPFVSSAHFIIGSVNDAGDGTPANDNMVVLWNPSVGTSDNLTDIIGPNGNSFTNNFYMIDCELLQTPCSIGDVLSVRIVNSSNEFVGDGVNGTVSGSGFDLFANLTLNSAPIFSSILLDDSFLVVSDEIDLIAGSTRVVSCSAIVEDFDEDNISQIYSELYSETNSFFGDSEDNNTHYTNSSCFVDETYGFSNQTEIICNYSMYYYSFSDDWECLIRVSDGWFSSNSTDSAFVNELLSIEVNDTYNFGRVNLGEVSDEISMRVYNKGNAKINLSLYGYGAVFGDGHSMTCDTGNISINFTKYNLTISNPGSLNLEQFGSLYKNLTSSSLIEEYNLDFRTNDGVDDAYDETYWRIYVPSLIGGNCTGNIAFGAVKGGAD